MSPADCEPTALEVRDTCVSKLMAGREKVFIFIRELMERGLVDMKVCIDRAEAVKDMPQSSALVPRLRKLETLLKLARRAEHSHAYRRLILRLQQGAS